MTPDHIPSKAAIEKAFKNKGFSEKELKKFYQDSATLLYETIIHQRYSRTYGGRNSAKQILKDSQDLYKAAQKDMEALRKPLLESGARKQDIERAFKLIHEMNRKKGLY